MNYFGLQAGPDPPGRTIYGDKGSKGYPGDSGSRGDHSISSHCFRSVLTDSVQLNFYPLEFLPAKLCQGCWIRCRCCVGDLYCCKIVLISKFVLQRNWDFDVVLSWFELCWGGCIQSLSRSSGFDWCTSEGFFLLTSCVCAILLMALWSWSFADPLPRNPRSSCSPTRSCSSTVVESFYIWVMSFMTNIYRLCYSGTSDFFNIFKMFMYKIRFKFHIFSAFFKTPVLKVVMVSQVWKDRPVHPVLQVKTVPTESQVPMEFPSEENLESQVRWNI